MNNHKFTYKEIDLGKIWQIIERDKKKVFISSGITTFIAIIYCIFATPIFTGKVLINPPKLTDASNSGFINLLSGIPSLGSITGGLMQKADTDIVAAILKSDAISDMVIKKFDLIKRYHKQDIEYTRKSLTNRALFKPDIKSGFLEIDVDDPDPKTAMDIANYYTVALGQLINNVAYNKNEQKAQFYANQLILYKDKLFKSQELLVAFESANGISAGHQVEITTELSAELQSQLVVAQSQLVAMSQYTTQQNPDYQKLQAVVDALKSQIAQLSKQPDSGDKLPELSGLAPKLAKEYYNLFNDVRSNTEIYNILIRQYHSAQIDALGQMSPVAVQVISSATLPIHKSKPKRLLIIIISFLLGALFSSLVLIIKKRKDWL